MKKFTGLWPILTFLLLIPIGNSSCSKEDESSLPPVENSGGSDDGGQSDNEEQMTNDCYRVRIIRISEDGEVLGLITERPKNAEISIMPVFFSKHDFPEWNYDIGDMVDIHIIKYTITWIGTADGDLPVKSYRCECDKVEPCK